MVATRKAAVTPASRNNSTQQTVTRNTQARAVASTSAPADNDVRGANKNTNGVTASKKTGKQKGKPKEKKAKKAKRPKSFIDYIARLALLWFTIYTLSVCPEDDHLKSPVCRGLYHYRRLILEPYVFPQLEAALKHPSIAPYYDAVKPHVEQAYAVAQPALVHARQEFNTHVVPQWEKRIVPAWNTLVLPQINKHVLPQVNKHVLPILKDAEAHLGPYRAVAEKEIHTRLAQYNHQLSPHLHTAIVYAGQLERAARPYVILAGQKAYEGFLEAKPYAAPAWEKFKDLLRQLITLLAAQRREFVDPHVAKMWEKVKERSGINPALAFPRATDTLKSVPYSASSFASSVSSAVASSASSISSSLHAASASEAVKVSDTASDIASSAFSASSAASSIYSEAKSTASSTAENVAASVSSAAKAASSGGSSIAAKLRADALSANFIPPGTEKLKDAASTVSSATSSVAEQVASSTYSAKGAVTTSEEDIEDILADILSEPDEEEVLESESAPAPTEKVETEEEKAERLAKVAAKRADITGRHSQWVEKLEAQIAAGEEAFRNILQTIRQEGVSELKSSPEVRSELSSLETDSEKYLKSAETYLKTLNKEGRSESEKTTLWDKVVDKVEAKFTKRLRDTETVVNTWYDSHRTKELQEADKHAGEAKAIADSAQSDLGMDYAWLDDVTYTDWQNYHDLVRRSDNFTRDLLAIQEGTHATPLGNPVLDTMKDLQSEVQDVVVGFENRLRRLRRDGMRSFSTAEKDEPASVEDGPIPEVSILPIPGDEPEPGVREVPPVVIGRGKEEVLEALGRVEAQEQTEALPPTRGDSAKTPEEIVDELAQEVESEAQAAESVGAVHVEL